ncbi:hypothetical protein ABIS04_00315 [Shewanella sp. H8]|uniref:hypothetical protein n=1 Tax=Shewanella sp. H8 TaxID=3342676 RepID=UPI0033164954
MTAKNNDDIPDDDIIEYDMSQRGNQVDDPLATVKTMRLEQLAVCRLKAEKEMQIMECNAKKNKAEVEE